MNTVWEHQQSIVSILELETVGELEGLEAGVVIRTQEGQLSEWADCWKLGPWIHVEGPVGGQVEELL